jgi:hypothetical protein
MSATTSLSCFSSSQMTHAAPIAMGVAAHRELGPPMVAASCSTGSHGCAPHHPELTSAVHPPPLNPSNRPIRTPPPASPLDRRRLEIYPQIHHLFQGEEKGRSWRRGETPGVLEVATCGSRRRPLGVSVPNEALRAPTSTRRAAPRTTSPHQEPRLYTSLLSKPAPQQAGGRHHGALELLHVNATSSVCRTQLPSTAPSTCSIFCPTATTSLPAPHKPVGDSHKGPLNNKWKPA